VAPIYSIARAPVAVTANGAYHARRPKTIRLTLAAAFRPQAAQPPLYRSLAPRAAHEPSAPLARHTPTHTL
jgi:hypothetical protein